MSGDFRVMALIELPISDYSELEMKLEELSLVGWELVSTFESYYLGGRIGGQESGDWLFGILRRAVPGEGLATG